MSEANLWRRTDNNLGPHGKLVRVENPACPGTPDVNYLLRRYPALAPVCGWVELKFEEEWPRRAKSIFRISKLNLDQVNWHTSWALAGGRVSTLLQVDTTILVLDHRLLAQVWAGDHTRASLLAAAPLVSDKVFPTAGLVKWLTAT